MFKQFTGHHQQGHRQRHENQHRHHHINIEDLFDFDEDENEFDDFFGSFGSFGNSFGNHLFKDDGDSFFGSHHFGGNVETHRSSGNCRTVTKRTGNSIMTMTECN